MLQGTENFSQGSPATQETLGAGTEGPRAATLGLANRADAYGLVSILLHWLTAPLVLGLFGLGLYMTSLDYYHPWYRSAPSWHKGLGVLVLTLVVLRLAWRLLSPPPHPLSPGGWERGLARWVHGLLYALLLALPLTGYLVSTADGRALPVFGWFEIPSLTGQIQHLEDIAGAVHYGLAWTLIALVALHGLGALKHHFIDRDATLLRMLGLARSSLPRRT